MSEKILIVDDESYILDTFKRLLHRQFDIEVAESGDAGLKVLDSLGPFAVVVSDMGMAGMNGIQFLTKVKERTPDSIRMMLTGQADLRIAIEAVNEGNIFRFLTKPIKPEAFAQVLQAGIRQYKLVTAEKELLEKTLSGSVKVLTEILSLVNPTAFSKTSRVTNVVTHIARQLQLSELWQFQLAAMLSQIGCVTLPPELLEKIYTQETLTDSEQKMFSSHPSVAGNLIMNIPRLESIAKMIEGQQKVFGANSLPPEYSPQYMVDLGSQILKVAIDYDQLVVGGVSHNLALSTLRRKNNNYHPRVLSALENYKMDTVKERQIYKKITTNQLKIGMVFEENILAKNGILVAPKGQEVTYPLLVRLRNLSTGIGIVEPFRVRFGAEDD